MIKLNVKGVWTEHAYVQKPILKQDCDEITRKQLLKYAENVDFYHNHFVFECVNELGFRYYVGYNDNSLYIGFGIGICSDSKYISIK